MPTIQKVQRQIQSGAYDSLWIKLYGEERLPQQHKRYSAALEAFAALYGTERDVRLYSAPGRTELGGNHTDHNRGIALAAAVNLDIIAVVSQNADKVVRVTSEGFNRTDEVHVENLLPQKAEVNTSVAMIRGVAAGIVRQKGAVGGFDAYTTSDVLRGSGLSSSAAFEVCITTIMDIEYNQGRFSPVEVAQISQYAENEFFGKPSGLLDQTACSVGGAITIDFKNPEKPIVQSLPFDLHTFGYTLVVTDTKGNHGDLTDEYSAIRFEMESVAETFGKTVLREVDEQDFWANISSIREKVGDRAVLRAIHFFEECTRAIAQAEAIKNKDFALFQQLVLQSGHSSFEYNQNAYSVATPKEQGVSLGLAISQHLLNGRGSWRLQGGGFAGTIQAFVPNDLREEYCTALEGVFGEGTCYKILIRPVGGTEILPE